MIEVAQLTRRYGAFTALDHVTFTIEPGEVVGLLGPNGAGKTTMLKMLTGYLPPSEGTAHVSRLNVLDAPLEVRRRIGYLPETNPLYDDLSVYESLLWTARLRAMPDHTIDPAIRKVVDVCDLSAVISRDVAQLSKGYRQRVGLAQAILHDPEILILDEPTSGLDPNQQQEVLQLIQTLKQKKTVILSTHILSEAQNACDRVLIIHQGKIVADGKPEILRQTFSRSHRLQILVRAAGAQAQAALSAVAGVERVAVQGEADGLSTLLVESGAQDVRERVFDAIVEQRWKLLELTPERYSLDDVFRALTTTS